MKKSTVRSTVSLSILVAAGAMAAATSVSATAQENAGVFVSGNVGRSEYDIGNGFGKKDKVVGGVGVGYAFNQNVAVELGFNDYGKVNVGGVDARARATHASLLLSAPIANEFSIYGRLGASSTDRKVAGFGASDSDRKTEAIYGIGTGYNFAKNVQGTLEFQQLQDSDVRAIAAGVKFRF